MKRFHSTIVKGKSMSQGIILGSQKVARAVQLTLGPGGRTVAIDPFNNFNYNSLSVKPQPIITKDGVTVAKAINM